MNHSKVYDMIVVGAGISGLSLACQVAKKGKQVLVLEGDNRIGGCLNTYYHDENDFWVEMGAHTFYASYTNLIALIQSSGLESSIEPRAKVGMKVFTDRHEKIMSGVSKWELLTSVPKLFFSKRDGKTVKEYFGNIVGKKNYDKVFNRMFSAVIVQNADDFSAEFFLKRRKTKSKEHPKSFILKKGMQSFMNALAETENITLLTGQKVVSVQKKNEVSVTTESGEEFNAKDIAFAVTPSVAGGLLAEINSDLAAKLKEYTTKNILSRTVVLPKEKLSFDPVSFIIPLQGSCLSMVTRDVMEHKESRGFAFHFEENSIVKEEQEALMAKILGVDASDLGETIVANHRLPVLDLGHKERIQEIQKLAEQAGVYLTGNYFNGLSLEDCVERSRHECERYMKNNS
ncbi:FAD-dependent oxidoreductase [Labilibaculum manganireducens]|uniref:protoporphyrinogen/coproporphyrinogen oxidase n=1 Tax=Labilibaculum manganireducens TaxID=1940525 RepID=UPI0029F4CC7B|nr:FAD-dependent oxidoreductase [Labilibaculum manganireducens]